MDYKKVLLLHFTQGLSVGGKMNLPPHGKEIFTNAVSSILHRTVRSFLHGTVNRILQITQ